MSVYGTSHSSRSKSASNCERHQISKSSRQSSATSTKPVDVFFVWYSELCRRQNTSPICAIRSVNNKNNQVLRFLADRIKIEDWQPIINALRLDTSLHVISVHSRLQAQEFMETVDTEEKVKKIKKWFGAVCTKYVMQNLIKSIVSVLRRSTVLTCLELSGLHITSECLRMICMTLPYNTSLKSISFKNCYLGDVGCNDICSVLHSVLNIEVIDLSGCGLGLKSCEYIAKLVRFQQINRYCESWHTSLRYEEPVVSNMAGLRRISINNNPGIGDVGLDLILNELMDDLWIKALDMQRCNITENMARRILDVVEYSKSLEVADFRHNNILPSTLESIFNVLKGKQGDYDNATEYNWCYTTTSISGDTGASVTLFTPTKMARKPAKIINNHVPLKRQATLPVLAFKQLTTLNKPQDTQNETTKLMRLKAELNALQEQLTMETGKRKETEEINKMLKKQIDGLLAERKKHSMLKEFKNMEQYLRKLIAFVREIGGNAHTSLQDQIRIAMQEVQTMAQYYESPSVTSELSTITEFTPESSSPDLSVNRSSQVSEDERPVRDTPVENVEEHADENNVTEPNSTGSSSVKSSAQHATKKLDPKAAAPKDTLTDDPLPKVKESINLNKQDMYQHLPESVASNDESTQSRPNGYEAFESEESSVKSMPTVRENFKWKIQNMFENMSMDCAEADEIRFNDEIHSDDDEHDNTSELRSSAASSAGDSVKFQSLRNILEKLLNECTEDDISAMRSAIEDQSKSK